MDIASGWLLGRESTLPITNTSWTNLVFATSFAEAIASADKGIPALYSLDWLIPDAARADPVTGKCTSKIPRIKPGPCQTIRPDYRAAWDQQHAKMAPFIANRTFIGVFLGDENMWRGLPLSNVTAMASYIKRTWPSAIVYMNEAQDIVHCNFNRLGDAAFAQGECVPEAVDWFGYDYYDYNYTYGEEAGWNVQRDGTLNMLVPRLTRPSQRVVPTTQGFFPGLDTSNATAVAEMDAYCVHNAWETYKWAHASPHVAGVFPFFFNPTPLSCVGAKPAPQCVSLMSLPDCMATWIEIGRQVVSSAGPRPSWTRTGLAADRAPADDASKSSCPTPTEKVPHRWCSWSAVAERTALREVLKGVPSRLVTEAPPVVNDGSPKRLARARTAPAPLGVVPRAEPRAAASRERATGFVQKAFVIGAFLEPPVEDAAYKSANMTYVHSSNPDHNAYVEPRATTLERIRLAEKHGLTATVTANCTKYQATSWCVEWGDPAYLPPPSDTLLGYYLYDEPNCDMQRDLVGPAKQRILAKQPNALVFVNLGAANGDPAYWHAKTYEEYIACYMKFIDPDVLAFDFYTQFGRSFDQRPMVNDTREEYLESVRLVSAAAEAHGKVWWHYPNLAAFGNCERPELDVPEPTESQLRWQVMLSLAHGTQGLLWYYYAPSPADAKIPCGLWHRGMVDWQGRPTPQFERVRRVNSDVLALHSVLAPYRMMHTIDLRWSDNDTATVLRTRCGGPCGGIVNMTRGSYVLTFWQAREGSGTACMVVNFLDDAATWTRIRFANPSRARVVPEMAAADAHPVPVADEAPNPYVEPLTNDFRIAFPAGGARLFLFD